MKFNRVGTEFGRNVYESDVDQLAEVFAENPESFSKSGAASVLRAMGIPGSFYLKQDRDLKTRMLDAQKMDAKAKARHFYLLGDNGKAKDGSEVIDFVAKQSPHGFEGPATLVGMTPERGWAPRRMDLNRGTIGYVSMGDGNRDMKKYYPSVMVTMPIFNSGVTTIEESIFKLMCTNGARARAFTGEIAIGATAFDPITVGSLVESMKTLTESSTSIWSVLLDRLNEKAVSVETAKKMIEAMLEHPTFPKTVILNAGKAFEKYAHWEVPEGPMPPAINTMMDVFDVLTYYAHELPGEGSVIGAERGVLGYAVEAVGLGTDWKELRNIRRQMKSKIPTTVKEEVAPVGDL